MTVVGDKQFELDGYLFGLNAPVLCPDEGFDPGTAGWDTQDQSNALADGGSFGRDRLRGPTWAWELGVDEEDEDSALATLALFATAWRAEDVRNTPGAVCTLRYTVGGRTRRVYGRPRRASWPPSNRILGGWIPITADFQCADALHYSDTETSESLDVTTSEEGGLTEPLEEPLSTVTSGAVTSGEVVVGGDAPTFVIVTFTGPVSYPNIAVNGWHCGINGWLADGESITVDSRPWAPSVLDQDGANKSGRLDRFTYLQQMRLTPGTHDLDFGGASEVEGATATVKWRDAFHAL